MFPTGRRTPLPRVAGGIATAVLLSVLAAGCTSDTAPGAHAPARTDLAPGATTTPTAAPDSAQVELPWPAPDAAAAAALQAEVDRGSQPWLLDPSEVAISYAAAAHDWPDAEAYPGPDGTSVDVRNADGERITLTLAQPARKGGDGIWVVTAEHR
ncbi:hypothetical protein [Pseudonocardia zijingensis]|uniref:hypothetical protein n=1 Tax=Pseudonocardia zijingensis TaxID=153376 RepID=UPI0031D33C9C